MAEKGPKTRAKATSKSSTTTRSKRAKKEPGGDVSEAPKKTKSKIELFPVDWTHELSFQLLTLITENGQIKAGLYPGPGQTPSTKNGGGKPKVDHQFALAEGLWSKESFWPKDAIKDSKTRGALATKIKNRLGNMEKEVRRINELMGETGQGMQSRDEIDMEADTQLTRTWKEVEESCPWYFEMKALVAERPNAKPVGLGNSTSGIDLSALDAAIGEENDIPDTEDKVQLAGFSESEDGGMLGGGVDTSSSAGIDLSDDDTKPEQKPSRLASKRKAGTPTTSVKKKFKISNEFAEVTGSLQKSQERALELAVEKERTKKAEFQFNAQYKLEKLKEKARRDERRHERKLAKYKYEAEMVSAAGPSSLATSTVNSQENYGVPMDMDMTVGLPLLPNWQ